MAKRKQREAQPSKPDLTEFEEFLINKIARCERVVNELSNNSVWKEIQEDYETSAKSLDLSWAFVDGLSPEFRKMQAAKMAAQSFLNLLSSYQHDLQMCRKQLQDFQNPKEVIKKDFDDEGIMESGSNTKETAYHG